MLSAGPRSSRKPMRSRSLDTPHRWSSRADALGAWILEAREALRSGGQINLRGSLPAGLTVIVAENHAQRHGGYYLSKEERRPIDTLVIAASPLLILAAHNATVISLRAFFNRRIPIWEGHSRDALATLVAHTQDNKGHPVAVAKGMIAFLGEVAVGFSPTEFGNDLVREVRTGCTAARRGKLATLQALGRCLLDKPDHRGIAEALRQLDGLMTSDAVFGRIHIDLRREFYDAVRLSEFADCEEGLSEINRRRTHARPAPPARAISTIHKAKGLECDHVLLMPCDEAHFRNSEASRCLLYVGMSRAMRSLTLVVSSEKPSPLFLV